MLLFLGYEPQSRMIRISNKVLIVLFYVICIVAVVLGQDGPGTVCHNDCSRRGYCNKFGSCDCFDGYEGNDCSKKICPKGPSINGIPYATDTAHREMICSGQGSCDYSTGLCTCFDGFGGHNCGRTQCMNDCSGNGVCISLRTAATENDGYEYSHTTVYNQWDADRIYGCKCDYGYIGPDCSQRSCEYGTDPRMSELTHESVTLVCDCTFGCDGKFKLRFMGYTAKSWLDQYSSIQDIVDVIMGTPGIYKDSGAYSLPPVYVENYHRKEPMCVGATKRAIVIKFRRNAGDLPALSFYANTMPNTMYFEVSLFKVHSNLIYINLFNSRIDYPNLAL